MRNSIVRKSSDDEPFSALAFKIMNDPFVGSLTFLKFTLGKLRRALLFLIQLKIKRDLEECCKCIPILERISKLHAGDIIAVAGLKDTTTGDTLCDSEKAVILEEWVPDPVIEVAEPKTKADQEKMGIALQLY